jgi:membrane protein
MKTIEPTGGEQKLGWRTQWHRLRALRWKDFGAVLQDVFNGWSEHRIPRLGAAVAFYTLLSLAPLLIIVVAIAGAVFGREAATGQLVWQIEDLIGYAGAEIVQTVLKTTQRPGAGLLATVLGSLALFIGATTAVAELRDALNTIWCVPRKEVSGLKSLVSVAVERTFAFIAVMAIGFLLLLSLAVNTAVAAFSEYYQEWMPTLTTALLQWTDLLIAWIVASLLFALVYKVLPDIDLEWRDVIPGAMVTSFLFSAGRLLIGMYLGRASYASAYGAAGSLVVLLVWIYYSAQIFFIGAEFTRSWAQNFGSKPCDRLERELKMLEVSQPSEPGHKPSEQMIKLP